MEAFSALLTLCAGSSPVSGEFPAQRPVTRSFDVFFDLRLIKRLSKHSPGWWFETLSCPLWRHCNVVSSNALFAVLRSHYVTNAEIPIFSSFNMFILIDTLIVCTSTESSCWHFFSLAAPEVAMARWPLNFHMHSIILIVFPFRMKLFFVCLALALSVVLG